VAAKKRKASVKKISHDKQPSLVIQFAVVFVIVAAMALVAYAYKNYL